MKTALISVFDKNGIVEFCKGLKDLGFQLISTGGTDRFSGNFGWEGEDSSSPHPCRNPVSKRERIASKNRGRTGNRLH